MTAVTGRPRAELDRPGMADEALYWIRDVLGTVAPRDPVTRRLEQRRYRLELLAELCERETFLIITGWLGSDAVPAVTSKQAYADDIRMWAGVARELGRHERFFIGCITPGMIETWTKTQKARGRSGRTINRRLSVLTALTQYAAWKTKETITSPVTRYDRVKIDPNDETTATPILEVPEFQAVVKACATPREAFVPVLIYTLAGRVSECCTAELDDLKTVGGECRLDLTRKGGKGRVWPLPPQLCELAEATRGGRASGPLLLDDDDRPMGRHAVDRMLNRLGRMARVLPGRELTPHVLRASKLTHMHDAGTDIREIQKYADHAHVETTLRYIRRRDSDALKARHAAAAVAVYDHLVDRWL